MDLLPRKSHRKVVNLSLLTCSEVQKCFLEKSVCTRIFNPCLCKRTVSENISSYILPSFYFLIVQYGGVFGYLEESL